MGWTVGRGAGIWGGGEKGAWIAKPSKNRAAAGSSIRRTGAGSFFGGRRRRRGCGRAATGERGLVIVMMGC